MNNPKQKLAGVSEYAAIILERMRAAHSLTREQLNRSSTRAKKSYDPKVKEKQYNVRDEVMLLNPRNLQNGNDVIPARLRF